MKKKKCTKCGGAGTIARFGYYENGICFRCKGTGLVIDRPPKTKREKVTKPIADIEWPF